MFLPLCCCQCWCLCFALLRCIKEKNTTTVQSNKNNARTHPAHRFFIQDCSIKKNCLRNYHVNYFHKQVRQLTQIRYLLKSNSGSIQVRSVCNHFFSYFKIFLFRKYLFSKNLISLWDFFFIIISISDSEIGKFSRRIQLLSWPKDPWYFIVKNLNIHKDVITTMVKPRPCT